VRELRVELSRLGIAEGDSVLVRVALKAIGHVDDKPATALMRAVLDVVGSSGTVVGLAFNPCVLFPWRHKKIVVTPDTPTISGGWAQAMVEWPGAVRSAHPTNSFVAVGARAAEFVDGHTEAATCFAPMEIFLRGSGKMILVGCVKSSPGFSTVHLAQERLGLATRSLLRGLRGVYYERSGRVRLFLRRDNPDCSAGFYKFYSHYVAEEKLRAGYVGDAYSVGIDCRDAYQIEYRLLERDPRFALCDNLRCLFCRGTRLYNKADMPGFYLRYGLDFIGRRLLWGAGRAPSR